MTELKQSSATVEINWTCIYANRRFLHSLRLNAYCAIVLIPVTARKTIFHNNQIIPKLEGTSQAVFQIYIEYYIPFAFDFNFSHVLQIRSCDHSLRVLLKKINEKP